MVYRKNKKKWWHFGLNFGWKKRGSEKKDKNLETQEFQEYLDESEVTDTTLLNNYYKSIDEERIEFTNLLNNYLYKKSIEYWDNAQTYLKSMKKEFEDLGEVPDEDNSVALIKYCVSILDIVARYQDTFNPVIQTSPDEYYEQLEFLNDDILFLGRHKPDQRMKLMDKEYPFWNISEPGDPVNLDTIRFGPQIDQKSRPASYWINLSKSKTIKISGMVTDKNGITSRKSKRIWLTDYLVHESAIHAYCTLARSRTLESLNILVK